MMGIGSEIAKGGQLAGKVGQLASGALGRVAGRAHFVPIEESQDGLEESQDGLDRPTRPRPSTDKSDLTGEGTSD